MGLVTMSRDLNVDIEIDDHLPDREDAESNHNDIAHEAGYVQDDWASGAEWDSDTPMTEDEL